MQRPVVLAAPEHHWSCPNCTATHITRETRPHTPFHACRGLKGLEAPFVRDGVRAKVEAVERGDYVGAEDVRTDAEGRPWMAVRTTRDEGEDVAVFAPTAHAKVRQL